MKSLFAAKVESSMLLGRWRLVVRLPTSGFPQFWKPECPAQTERRRGWKATLLTL